MSRINLAPHYRFVEEQDARDAKHEQARKELDSDTQAVLVARDRLRALSQQFDGETIPIEVVKSWLYTEGFTDSETRSALWAAVDVGFIDFDRNYDVKCGQFPGNDD